MNREDADRRVAYWRGYLAALRDVNSVTNDEYVRTVAIPKAEASVRDAEETLAIFDKEVI